jgi:hypothetical protein
MTPEEVKDYGERVERMAKKEPAYPGWGFFCYKSVYKNKEDVKTWEATKKTLQHLKKLKFQY